MTKPYRVLVKTAIKAYGKKIGEEQLRDERTTIND